MFPKSLMVRGKHAKKKLIAKNGFKPPTADKLAHAQLKATFIEDVAKAWGKQLNGASRMMPKAGPEKADQLEISFVFGDIPFVVFGVKGVGPAIQEAHTNAAWNFISYLESGFLPKDSIALLRAKWSMATAQMAQIVEVCRHFERALQMDEYASLRTVDLFTYTPADKALANVLRANVRQFVSTGIHHGMPIPSLFTPAGQKRKLNESLDASYEAGPSQAKRIATGLALDPIVLDDAPTTTSTVAENKDRYVTLSDDEEGFSYEYEEKLKAADVQLHVTGTPRKETVKPSGHSAMEAAVGSGTAIIDRDDMNSEKLNDWHALSKTKAFGGHSTLYGWCKASNIPFDYERVLVGVNYCGSDSIQQMIDSYMLKYKKECRRVDKEIWGHFHTNAQNSEIYAWKMHVREQLLSEFRSAFQYQDIKMYAVGSTVNGCGSFNSDMDLCLCVPEAGSADTYRMSREGAIKTLRKLNGLMRSKAGLRKIVKRAEVIPAKVPIIKMVLHPPFEELDLDININNVAGIYNSHLVHYYSRMDCRFPCLSLLVKHWAINAGISDAMTGTFNSYSLILMVLHYLQCGVKPAILPNLQYLFPERFAEMPPLAELELHKNIEGLPLRPVNVATCIELLIGFFHYYANFDFYGTAISIRNAKTFPRFNSPEDSQNFMMYIEEPFDGKNTARCVTKVNNLKLIQRAFDSAKKAFSVGAPDLGRIGVNI